MNCNIINIMIIRILVRIVIIIIKNIYSNKNKKYYNCNNISNIFSKNTNISKNTRIIVY